MGKGCEITGPSKKTKSLTLNYTLEYTKRVGVEEHRSRLGYVSY
jgi:hypothetical protein